MCTQKPPHDYSKQLYERYKKTLEDYIKSTVRARARLLISLCLLAIYVLRSTAASMFLPCAMNLVAQFSPY
jgi:hypothetical protein